MTRRPQLSRPGPTPDSAAIPLGDDDRRSRLVAVAAQQVADQGMAGASARSIAAAAGAAASAINYNFGTLERLFSKAFESGAARTADWLEARSRELRALPRSPEAAVRALAYVIVEWTRGARPLALLYQECLAATPGEGPGAAWTRLWRDFWLRTAEEFGLGEVEGRLMHLFFESEGLYHLSGWSPALEAAALGELADHFGAVWLGAAPRTPIGALALAEQSAGVLATGQIAPSAIRIAEAAAEVVEGGLGGLTHRAVAARAGVTTGAVTHHFRTIEDLVAGAIRGQVLALAHRTQTPSNAPPVERIASLEGFLAALRFHSTGAATPPPVGRRQPFLAAIRRPELAGAGAVIRFAHGGTARDAIDRFFEPQPGTLELYAGAVSRLSATMWYACSADEAPRESREQLIGEVEARLLRSLPVKAP